MNKYLTFDDEYDMYDIKKPVLAKFLISQGFDKRDIKQWFDDHDAYDESIINSFDDLEESTEEEIEDWAKTEMEFYSEGNDFNINENKMNKELLRMQMLAGVITESEYKDKMNENQGYIDVEYPSGDYVGEINGDKVTFKSILLNDDNEYEEFDNFTLSDVLDYLGPDHFLTQLVLKTEDEDGDVTAEFDIAGDEIEITVDLDDLKSNFGKYITQ
jgi:hypothetical protein